MATAPPPIAEVPGSERPPLAGATSAGAWPADEYLEVTVFLRRTAESEPLAPIAVLGAQPLADRSYLTRAEFADRYGASRVDVEHVTASLVERGLMVHEVDRARRALTVGGPAREIGRFFGVDLLRYDHPSGPYRGYVGPVRVPAEIGERVVGVFGLDSRPQLRTHLRRAVTPPANGYPIPTVGAAYQFPPIETGELPTIALLEFGGGFADSDLASFFASLGLAVPEVVTVGVDGATNSPTGDASGPDGEVELDVEMIGALAPGATIVVYFAPNTEQGFIDALTRAIHDTVNAPGIVSISWGSPESGWSAQARSALETAAQDAAAQGVTILAASGDQGASDGEPSGTLTVDFPASSPYVLGCGGTRLELNGTSIVSEVVWNDLSQNEGATGGGVSEDFALPSFQSAAHVPAAPNGFTGRGVPDVAANADPETGYAVFIDGQTVVLGGTSAVAPLWAALVARLGNSLAQPLGYANPLLYPIGAAFRPITSGNNDGYSAGPGWNACTGLGTPQGQTLLASLRSASPPAPPPAPAPAASPAAAPAKDAKPSKRPRRGSPPRPVDEGSPAVSFPAAASG